MLPLVSVVCGLAFAVLGFLGMSERLPRNRFGGVRTSATMRSDETFRVGNKVAGLPLMVAGLVGVLGGGAAFLMPSRAGSIAAVAIGLLGMFVIVAGGGLLGHRAAEQVREPVPAGCGGCACGGGGCAAKFG